MWRSLNLAGRAGTAIGALGALAGAAAAIAANPLVGSIMTVVFFGVIIGAFSYAWGPQTRRSKLMRQGTEAWATILSIQETGWTVQGNYGLAKLGLSVEPPDGGSAYEVQTKALINRFDIPQYQPGARVQVAIDPRDRNKVAVV